MARTLSVPGFRVISELGPSRRQRQVRKRWIAIAVACAATALVALVGHLTDRNDAATRESASSMALMSSVVR
jgi:hypothetical protein